MKRLIPLTLWALVSLAQASMPAAECFDELPGEVSIPFDTPDKVKITEVTVSSKGTKAFVATEYLGSPTLQASVYLQKGKQYCFAGDLGAAIAFKGTARTRSEGYYGLIVESKSGLDKFYRTFHYRAGIYTLASCRVKPINAPLRACTDSEK